MRGIEFSLGIYDGNTNLWQTGWRQGSLFPVVPPISLSCKNYNTKLELRKFCSGIETVIQQIIPNCPAPVSSFIISREYCSGAPIDINCSSSSNVATYKYEISEVDVNNAIILTGFSWIRNWTTNHSTTGS